MKEEKDKSEEEFLSRWSRLKREARESPDAPAPAKPAADDDTPAPELPPVDELTLDSDFRGFFHPKVDEDLRRSALKKLFSEPHFNVMDGLDTYIDDYSKSDPLPAAMLAQLRHAQKIFQWARETDDKTKQDAIKAGAASEPEGAPVTQQEAVQPLADQSAAAETPPEPSAQAGRKNAETVAGHAAHADQSSSAPGKSDVT